MLLENQNMVVRKMSRK